MNVPHQWYYPEGLYFGVRWPRTALSENLAFEALSFYNLRCHRRLVPCTCGFVELSDIEGTIQPTWSCSIVACVSALNDAGGARDW